MIYTIGLAPYSQHGCLLLRLEKRARHQVGETRTVNGKTQHLNEKHRWTNAKESANAPAKDSQVHPKSGSSTQQLRPKDKPPGKLQQLRQKAKHFAVHEGDELGRNVAAWKVGKVVGGAVATFAIAHGAAPVATAIISQSVVQGGAATAFWVAQKKNKGEPIDSKELASFFIKQTSGAYLGKYAHYGTEWALNNLGVKEVYEKVGAIAAGKITGLGTVKFVGQMHIDSRITEVFLNGSEASLGKLKNWFTGDRSLQKAAGIPPEITEILWKLCQISYAVALHEQQGKSLLKAAKKVSPGQLSLLGDEPVALKPKESKSSGLKVKSRRARKGGEYVAGRYFKGGQWIPKDALEAENEGLPLLDLIQAGASVVNSHYPAVEAAQQELDSANDELMHLRRNFDRLSDKDLTPDEAFMYRKLRDKDIPAAEHKIKALERSLKQAKSDAGVKEEFEAGRPLSMAEITRPLTQDEMDLMGDRIRIKDPRQYSAGSDGRYRIEQQIRAYHQSREEFPGLTVPEFKAIRAYTFGAGYIGPNGAARGIQENPDSDLARQQRIEARLVHQALDRLPVYEGEVRRDTRIPSNQFESYQVGNTLQFSGVTSTTTDLSGAATAAYGSYGEGAKDKYQEQSKAGRYQESAKKLGIRPLNLDQSVQVELHMQVRSGREISKISAAAQESEVALQHGWRGRITKVEDLGDRYKVYMEEA